MARAQRSDFSRLAAVAVVALLLEACGAQAPAASPSDGSAGATRPSATAEATTSAPPIMATPTPGAPTAPGETPPPGAKVIHHVSCEPQVDGDATPSASMPCDVSMVLVGDDFTQWSATIEEGPCQQWATAPDLSVFVACEGPTGLAVHCLDSAGRALHGWPIRLPGWLPTLVWNDFDLSSGDRPPAIAGAADGTVYVAVRDGEDRIRLHAFGRDGRARAGWPQPLPGEPGGILAVPGFLVADDGSIRTWGYEGINEEEGLGYGPFASRTVYSALSPDGETLEGWPRGSTGTASGPLVGRDGTLYYVSATGRVWAHDRRGEIRPGWPYILPELARPYLTTDGRLMVVLSDAVVALTADGTSAPGWPYTMPGPRQSRCLAPPGGGDTDCYGVAPPALGEDGTLYLPLEPLTPGRGTAIVALDAHGEAVPGWPHELPANTYTTRIDPLAVGWIALWLTTCDSDSCDWLDDTLILGTDGEPVY